MNNRLNEIERIAAFQNGGQPHKESTDELLARMRATYGGSSSPPTTVSPAAAPPAPVPPKPKQEPGGILGKAVGLLKGRQAQIDQAAGYANGGALASTPTTPAPVSSHWSQDQDLVNQEKTQRWAAEDLLKKAQSEGTRSGRQALYGLAGQAMAAHQRQFGYAQGGKIEGPGTPTSDSIPAQVKETGENILVSNQERIVSAEQDIILERIAEMLGFESVDAMFEQLTGKPVGPTIKRHRRAAASGMGPYDYDPATVGQPEPDGKVSPLLTALTYSSDREAYKARNQPAPYSNEGRVKPTAEAHPFAVPASRPGANVPSSISTDVGNGIRRTVETGKPTNYTNVQPGGQVLDDSASALRDQQSNDPYWTPAAQLERMQRRRLMTDATDPTITDPAVRESAQKGLLLLNQGADVEQKTLAANQAKQLAGLHGKLLDPKTPVEEQRRIAQALAAMRGQGGEKPAELRTVDVEELLDPKQPLLGTRKVPHVFDPRTGQSRPMLQPSSDPTAQARAAIARGADPKAVNARLRSMGLPEVQ